MKKNIFYSVLILIFSILFMALMPVLADVESGIPSRIIGIKTFVSGLIIGDPNTVSIDANGIINAKIIECNRVDGYILCYNLQPTTVFGNVNFLASPTIQGTLSTKGLSVNANGDHSMNVGYGSLGYDGTNSNFFTIAHKDCFNTSDYALSQTNGGVTLLNSSQNQAIYLRNGNSTIGQVDSVGISTASNKTIGIGRSADPNFQIKANGFTVDPNGVTKSQGNTVATLDPNGKIPVANSYTQASSNTNPILDLHFNELVSGNASRDSSKNHVLRFMGNAVISNSVYKYNNSSLSVDGNGDYLVDLIHSDKFWFDANFTIETYVRFNSIPANDFVALFAIFGDANNQVSFYFENRNAENNSGMKFSWANNGTWYSIACSNGDASNWLTDTWYHIALVRSGSTFKWYKNGSCIATVTEANPMWYYTNKLTIGGSPDSNKYLNGYMDEVKFYDYAKYTGDFTPAEENINY